MGKVPDNPFPEQGLANTRKRLSELLDTFKVRGQAEVTAPHQLIEYALAGRMARAMDDPDWIFLAAGRHSAAKGVKLGADEKLPRVPAVFEKKTTWRRYEEEDRCGESSWKENYKSASENAKGIRKQFEEEESLGMLVRVSRADAEAEWGDKLAIAGLAAIAKGEDSWRVIHDGTHAVKVNPKIKVRDLVRYPSVAEQRRILEDTRDRPSPHFIFKGDISKAHRRVRVRRSDWGQQACRLDQPDEIWLNTVGTFGIASAGYYWTRAISVIARTLMAIMDNEEWWQLLFVDDFSWTFTGEHFLRNVLFVVYFYCVLRVPFAWKKFAGGHEFEWVGFWINIDTLSAGISEKRKTWVLKWIDEVTGDTLVKVKNCQEVLGRLQFVATALITMKPFLGPLYAWIASLPEQSCLPLPVSIKLILRFIAVLLQRCNAMAVVRPPAERAPLRFRADAKAEGEDVALGGWLCHPQGPKHSRWFAVRITRESAPWAYWAGDAYKAIATLELFATLPCVMAFGPPEGAEGMICLSGDTDNKGYTYIVNRLMTTKFPVRRAHGALPAARSSEDSPRPTLVTSRRQPRSRRS